MQRTKNLVNSKFREFFWPSILMAASNSLSLVIDSIIVGNVLGSRELAAMNLILPVSLCYTAIVAIIGIGGSTLISVKKGGGDDESSNKAFTVSFVCGVILGIVGILIGLLGGKTIAAFLAVGSGLESFVYEYLKVFMLGSPFTVLLLILPHIAKADGQPKFSSVTLVVSNLSNLILDVVFMKFLGMGLAGGALATISGYALGTIMYILYFKSSKRTIKFTPISLNDFAMIKEMFKLSISTMLGQGVMFAKMFMFNNIISREVGAYGLAIYAVCNSLLAIVSLFIAGAAQTMIPMVGAFRGEKDYTSIENTIKRTITVLMISSIAVTIILEIAPAPILRLYGVTDPEIIRAGIVAIRLFSLAFVGISFSFITMYYMQVIGRFIYSMSICVLEGFVVIVSVCILLVNLFGDNGVWISYPVNELIIALYILAMSKVFEHKSAGKIHSIFLFKKDERKKLELSVDVSLSEDREGALNAVEAFAGENGRTVMQDIFEIVTSSNVKNQKLLTDLLVYETDEGKISINTIDLFTPHIILPAETKGKITQLEEKIERVAEEYKYTLVIGMNSINILFRNV